jgi:hypothetical protein
MAGQVSILGGMRRSIAVLYAARILGISCRVRGRATPHEIRVMREKLRSETKGKLIDADADADHM